MPCVINRSSGIGQVVRMKLQRSAKFIVFKRFEVRYNILRFLLVCGGVTLFVAGANIPMIREIIGEVYAVFVIGRARFYRIRIDCGNNADFYAVMYRAERSVRLIAAAKTVEKMRKRNQGAFVSTVQTGCDENRFFIFGRCKRISIHCVISACVRAYRLPRNILRKIIQKRIQTKIEKLFIFRSAF